MRTVRSRFVAALRASRCCLELRDVPLLRRSDDGRWSDALLSSVGGVLRVGSPRSLRRHTRIRHAGSLSHAVASPSAERSSLGFAVAYRMRFLIQALFGARSALCLSWRAGALSLLHRCTLLPSCDDDEKRLRSHFNLIKPSQRSSTSLVRARISNG